MTRKKPKYLNRAALALFDACRALLREQVPCNSECPRDCSVGLAKRAVDLARKGK